MPPVCDRRDQGGRQNRLPPPHAGPQFSAKSWWRGPDLCRHGGVLTSRGVGGSRGTVVEPDRVNTPHGPECRGSAVPPCGVSIRRMITLRAGVLAVLAGLPECCRLYQGFYGRLGSSLSQPRTITEAPNHSRAWSLRQLFRSQTKAVRHYAHTRRHLGCLQQGRSGVGNLQKALFPLGLRVRPCAVWSQQQAVRWKFLHLRALAGQLVREGQSQHMRILAGTSIRAQAASDVLLGASTTNTEVWESTGTGSRPVPATCNSQPLAGALGSKSIGARIIQSTVCMSGQAIVGRTGPSS